MGTLKDLKDSKRNLNTKIAYHQKYLAELIEELLEVEMLEKELKDKSKRKRKCNAIPG
jgi:hypothetical protein